MDLLSSLIQREQAKIVKKITALQSQLSRLNDASLALDGEDTDSRNVTVLRSKPKTGRGRHLSPEGRARIIAAAKKRWRKYHRAA